MWRLVALVLVLTFIPSVLYWIISTLVRPIIKKLIHGLSASINENKVKKTAFTTFKICLFVVVITCCFFVGAGALYLASFIFILFVPGYVIGWYEWGYIRSAINQLIFGYIAIIDTGLVIYFVAKIINTK